MLIMTAAGMWHVVNAIAYSAGENRLGWNKPDHGPPDPKNPTRPDQVMGRARAEIFDPKLKKIR